MVRKQFTFYRSFWEAIENLPTNKEKLQVYQILCDYALNRTEPDLRGKKPSVTMVFQLVKPVLERAHDRAQKMQTVNDLSTM